MKVKINIEWRKKEEPGLDPEFLVRTALKSAGYHVGHVEIQGVWDEDKPKLNVLTTKEYKKLERKYKNENK